MANLRSHLGMAGCCSLGNGRPYYVLQVWLCLDTEGTFLRPVINYPGIDPMATLIGIMYVWKPVSRKIAALSRDQRTVLWGLAPRNFT
jgi:hypothetical protein